MPYSSYNYLSGLTLGETNFVLEKDRITSSYIDFILKIYGNKWQNVDIAFEYRFNDYDQWRTDAFIIGSQSNYIQDNKLLGLNSSSYGFSNKFRWKYSANNILEGMEIKIRIKLLPRIKHYSYYSNSTVISESYGESFFDSIVATNKKCIGKDLYGRYICLDNDSVSIYEELEDSIPLYILSGLNQPVYVKQIRSGSYIVAEYGANTIFEMDETLANLLKSYSVSLPIYFDFSEQNESLLFVSSGSSTISEITWSEIDYGNAIWSSDSIFTNPSCANYNTNNFDEIVAVDSTKVYLLNKRDNIYTELDKYSFSNGIGEEKSKVFWNPYRAYFYNSDTICVIEKDGEIVNFDSLYTSSSSSIDSSSSSSSNSSTSSSSSSSSSSSDF